MFIFSSFKTVAEILSSQLHYLLIENAKIFSYSLFQLQVLHNYLYVPILMARIGSTSF